MKDQHSGFAKVTSFILILTIAIGFFLFSFRGTQSDSEQQQAAVVAHYADIAFAVFSDSLTLAKQLHDSIDELLATPNEESLAKARSAWLASRIPYGQSEVFRFSNPNVDAWEGKVNAWPLDEGLIDYVDASYQSTVGNTFGLANVIADATTYAAITPELLSDTLHEVGSEEANVATGYHAIEFLLWGQDLNLNPNDAGKRPATDYALAEVCTNGNCDRRREYLKVIADMLVADLEEMVVDWDAAKEGNYRATLLAEAPALGLQKMLRGMGEMSLGELASERMLVGLAAHDQEEEHSCFSDSTHTDIIENARGVSNIYHGRYERLDGSVLEGPSLSALLKDIAPDLDKQLVAAFDKSLSAAADIVETATASVQAQSYDQLLSATNTQGHKLINATVEALVEQTALIQQASITLGIDSLNIDPGSCFNPDGSDNGQCL